MSPVRAEDLPPNVRKQLGLDVGRGRPKNAGDPTGKPKKSRAGVGLSEPCAGHCGCGAPFPTALAWEKHAKQTGCRHWRIDLPIPKGAT